MVRIKLEGITQPLGGALGRVPGAVAKRARATGVFSLRKGFRDFILRGTVVDLAVAVVLGTAFTGLVSSATTSIITPLIAAIFAGSNFAEASFYVNGSRFKYGDFINALITFVLVVLFLYGCVVVPLEKLQYAAFRHRAILRPCPFCLEDISLAATRCKHCCGEVPLDEAMQQTLQLATAAMDAQEQARQRRWRCCAPCVRCCFQGRRVAVDRDAQLQPVAPDLELAATSPAAICSPPPERLSSSGGSAGGRAAQRATGSSSNGGNGGNGGGAPAAGSPFVSPQQSFTDQQPAPSTSINIEAIMTAQDLKGQ